MYSDNNKNQAVVPVVVVPLRGLGKRGNTVPDGETWLFAVRADTALVPSDVDRRLNSRTVESDATGTSKFFPFSHCVPCPKGGCGVPWPSLFLKEHRGRGMISSPVCSFVFSKSREVVDHEYLTYMGPQLVLT